MFLLLNYLLVERSKKYYLERAGLQDLRRKIYLKAKADKTWRENAVASAGTDGVGPGCIRL